ncbi:MAG: 2OG-Fe(II) oxygenase family protein, partial [Candidatus Dadabacteria bacterium]|nr:2OG-Fe(II) oxygenase family protein [Candidatus Dadabacteria bacterium]
MRYGRLSATAAGSAGLTARLLVFAALVLLAVLAFGPASDAKNPHEENEADGEEIPFGDAEIRIEVNSTDGDAGLQIFLDGEPWRRVRIEDPRGKLV